MPKKMKFTEFFFRQGEASEIRQYYSLPLSGKVAKLSVSEILPIVDKKADLTTAAVRWHRAAVRLRTAPHQSLPATASPQGEALK